MSSRGEIVGGALPDTGNSAQDRGRDDLLLGEI